MTDHDEHSTQTPKQHSLTDAFVCAVRGIQETVATQRNAKIHAVASIVALVGGIWLHVSWVEWLIIMLCIGMVWTAELFNTALEAVVDLASPEHHELARRAKDCAAGAVLAAAVTSATVAILIVLRS